MENEKQTAVAKKLNLSVSSVLTNNQVIGFEKAFLVASAIEELKTLLTSEYMKPIMAMQGNKLGFKTDRDKDGGYPENVVKNCLIEAVLMGLQPTGNQFNIIAGNTYATKEGVGELLKGMPGLHFQIDFELPRINADKSSAAVEANVEWTIEGHKQSKVLKIPVKMNSSMGTDAVLGKATRKARKWLYDTITGSELPEGDVQDADIIIIPSKEEIGNSKKQELKEKQAEAKTVVEPNGQGKIEMP